MNDLINKEHDTIIYLKNLIQKIEKINFLLFEYKKIPNYNEKLVFKIEWLLNYNNWNELNKFDNLLDNSYKNILEEMEHEYNLNEQEKKLVQNFFSQLRKY